jgi:hypothetical protein
MTVGTGRNGDQYDIRTSLKNIVMLSLSQISRRVRITQQIFIFLLPGLKLMRFKWLLFTDTFYVCSCKVRVTSGAVTSRAELNEVRDRLDNLTNQKY